MGKENWWRLQSYLGTACYVPSEEDSAWWSKDSFVRIGWWASHWNSWGRGNKSSLEFWSEKRRSSKGQEKSNEITKSLRNLSCCFYYLSTNYMTCLGKGPLKSYQVSTNKQLSHLVVLVLNRSNQRAAAAQHIKSLFSKSLSNRQMIQKYWCTFRYWSETIRLFLMCFLLCYCLIYSGRTVVFIQMVPWERGRSSKQLCEISSSVFDSLHYISAFLEVNSWSFILERFFFFFFRYLFMYLKEFNVLFLVFSPPGHNRCIL